MCSLLDARSLALAKLFKQNLLEGLDVTTSYSGCGTADLSLQLAGAGVSGSSICFYAACDNDPTPQYALASPKDPPSHIFAGVLDRCPPHVIREAKVVMDSIMTKCLEEDAVQGEATRKSRKVHLGFEVAETLVALLKDVNFTPRAPCVRCNDKCCTDPKAVQAKGSVFLGDARPSQLHLEVAGVTCAPWSAFQGGDRTVFGRWLRKCTLVMLAWACWCRAIKPNFIAAECISLLQSAYPTSTTNSSSR